MSIFTSSFQVLWSTCRGVQNQFSLLVAVFGVQNADSRWQGDKHITSKEPSHSNLHSVNIVVDNYRVPGMGVMPTKTWSNDDENISSLLFVDYILRLIKIPSSEYDQLEQRSSGGQEPRGETINLQ